MDKICYWDSVTGSQHERDATAEEQAGIDARRAAALIPEIPQRVTMRQARLALLGAGLLGTVDAAINALPGIQGSAARIEWEFSNEVNRGQPLISSLVPVLGITDKQIDDLFILAATL